MFALIAAYDKNRVIGSKGRIPWRIKGEQRRFRELTTGNIVLMGRRTYEEIGRPLPNRYTIVISSTRSFEEENCHTVKSLEEALEYAANSGIARGKHIYVAGGAALYREAVKIADALYITEIDGEFEGDAFFPEFDESRFNKTIEERTEGTIPYTYVTYRRK